MLNILIDLYKIKNLYSGLGQFSMNFAKELANQSLENYTLEFLIPRKSKVRFSGNNISTIKTSFFKRYFPILNKKYSIWHSLQQDISFRPPKNTIWILTIHDLNFLIEKKGTKIKKYITRLQKNIDRADYITAISNYTKEKIQKNVNVNRKKIHVIYNGVDFGTNTKKTKPTFIKNEKFFFTIGIIRRKKNFKTLVPIMQYFKDHHLVIAGNKNHDYGREIEEEINKLNLSERVILPGEINESNKRWLYANCEAFLFPSLAEGFGLPVIEAMYAGKPVFLSKHTSLPEIGGNRAFYFENFDSQEMANLIKSKLKLISNNLEKFSVEQKKYAQKFNWKNCINGYLALYREIEKSHISK